MDFMNIFINFIKKFLIKRQMKNKIKTLKKIKVLLLLVLDFFTKFWYQ